MPPNPTNKKVINEKNTENEVDKTKANVRKVSGIVSNIKSHWHLTVMLFHIYSEFLIF